MKWILLFSAITLGGVAQAANLETRLADLENRVQALEKVVAEKLAGCEMRYLHFNYRLNRCDEGTFARSVTDVGNGVFQLECGQYQLQCITEKRPDVHVDRKQ